MSGQVLEAVRGASARASGAEFGRFAGKMSAAAPLATSATTSNVYFGIGMGLSF